MSLLRRMLRYATVSVVSTCISLTVLGVLVATRTVSAGWANVVATAVGTVPSFELNRRWVWGKQGRRSILSEIGPFCSLSFVGLGLSTVAVSLAAAWAARMGFDNTLRTVTVEVASIASFGSLWLLQFVVLDRLMFANTQTRAVEV